MSISIDAKNIITIHSVDEFKGQDTYITNDTNNNYPIITRNGNLRNYVIDMINTEGTEIYKKVKYFPNYSISSHGKVRNDKTSKIVVPVLFKNIHYQVR